MLTGGFLLSGCLNRDDCPAIRRAVTYLQPFYIAGATGSGKSALALALAQRVGGEIVNADAFQLYRQLDICTAKPSLEERSLCPHHLFDVLALSESCDAAFYTELARPVIEDILKRGRLPIVVGGSGLYLKALTHGLANVPSDESMRLQLAELTAAERVEWLLVRDPTVAATMNLKNDRYVSRALEICLLTGQPQSELRQSWKDLQPAFDGICLKWDRETLNARLDRRVLAMVEAGLVNEIASLGEFTGTAVKAIGVRDVQRHLACECSLEEAIAAIQMSTRRYAKRQRSWFRRETGFKIVEMREDKTPVELADEVLEVFPHLNAASAGFS